MRLEYEARKPVTRCDYRGFACETYQDAMEGDWAAFAKRGEGETFQTTEVTEATALRVVHGMVDMFLDGPTGSHGG